MASPSSIAAETQRLFDSGKVREPRRAGRILTSPTADPLTRHPSTAIHVCACGAFDAAQWLYGRGAKSVCVLDFASDTTAGGGWRGNQVGTQEESLCRNSSLGRALEALPYPLPALGVAYVPEVAVLRVESAPRTLLSPPFHVAAVAAALRDVGGDDPDKKQRAFLAAKVEGVLCAMAGHRHDVIVLGSWGCGAFGNPHALVAEAFAAALGGRFAHAFVHVAFADPSQVGQEAFLRALRPLGAARRPEDEEGKIAPTVAVRRALSEQYGAGASAHTEEAMVEWVEAGVAGREAAQRREWALAAECFARCVALRPEWAKGHELLARARARAA